METDQQQPVQEPIPDFDGDIILDEDILAASRVVESVSVACYRYATKVFT